jgi:succinate dehydrogenase/fumarate reductase flavoprotein subunit
VGLATPLFLAAARAGGVQFQWSTKVLSLLVKSGAVVGARIEALRTGRRRDLRASAVLLATGGFQSNLALVRASWPRGMPPPQTLLSGSGLHSQGSGLNLARAVGGAVRDLDHQWNYVTGIPDPTRPGSGRGLHVRLKSALWVNLEGRRFANESASSKSVLPVLLRQPTGSYLAVFDDKTKHDVFVAGSDWEDFRKFERLVLRDPAVTSTAASLPALAARIGVPPDALVATVDHYNLMVDRGEDVDFQRFGPGKSTDPRRIDAPPYYAIRFFPITRKSMGGVVVDDRARVVGAAGRPIAGLYAAGELTGVARLNGRAALEGTFLGPSILMGRIAARTVLATARTAALRAAPSPAPAPISAEVPRRPITPANTTGCLGCHDLPRLARLERPGFLHFEGAHRIVLERRQDCSVCHAELSPLPGVGSHRIGQVALAATCTGCHLSRE